MKKEVDFSDWEELKPSQFAQIQDPPVSQIRKLCREGKIEGAYKSINKYWIIPREAKINA
jgi:hypothetical protein